MYDVGDCLPVDSFPPGTNVLLSAPARADADEVLFDLLVAGQRREEGTVVFTTASDAAAVRTALSGRDGGDGSGVGVVDCVDSDGQSDGLDFTRHVASPGDFTNAGVAISELLEEMGHRHERTRVGVHSVSDLLGHADVKTVFRFLHVLTGRIGAADALGIATLDPDVHDDQTVTTIRQLFDGLVELRVDGGRGIRVSGPSDQETEWQSF